METEKILVDTLEFETLKHKCMDYVCYGMDVDDDGGIRDYWYCGFCNKLLQVG